MGSSHDWECDRNCGCASCKSQEYERQRRVQNIIDYENREIHRLNKLKDNLKELGVISSFTGIFNFTSRKKSV